MPIPIRCLVLSLLLAVAGLPPAAAFDATEVPEPLRPWIGWVRPADAPEGRCALAASDDGWRCVWNAGLRIELAADGAKFSGRWRLDREDWLPLPGDAMLRPRAVEVDGKPAVVLLHDGLPALRLPAGTHTVSGRLYWGDEAPALLPLPPGSGLIELVGADGQPLAVTRAGGGGLQLAAGADDDVREADHLELDVRRRVDDELPMRLRTEIVLRVAGRAREAVLGTALPPGFVPMALDSPLPARLEADGRLRVQLQPGVWTIAIEARAAAAVPPSKLAPPAQDAPWPEAEVWAWAARPELRTVSLRGAQPIDPQQTTLPAGWRALPVFVLGDGRPALELVERARGEAETPPDRLGLVRTLWLDFDGGGWTAQDRLRGSVARSDRLDAAAPYAPGRVTIGGEDQFITRLDDAAGVELRAGRLDLAATGRIEAAAHAGRLTLPAVGWRIEPQSLGTVLQLPPGWRLLGAEGPARADGAWLARWNLLDFFLLLLTTLAIGRLAGPAYGALALLGLALVWHEPEAPRALWLNLAAALALLRVLPAGRLAKLAGLWRGLGLAALAIACLAYAVPQVRGALYAQLAPPDGTRATSFADEEAALGGLAGNALTLNAPAAAPPPAPMVQAEPADEAGARRDERTARERAIREYEQRKMAKSQDGSSAPRRQQQVERYTADVKVQTGPGQPDWRWSSARLDWSGPVAPDATLTLWLLSPPLAAAWRLVGVLVLFVLLWRLARCRPRPPAAATRVGPPLAPAAAALLLPVVALGLAGLPRPAAADFPPETLLEELRTRLNAPPACAPQCAALERLQLTLDDTRLRIRADYAAAADTLAPLPLAGSRVEPAAVTLDGQPAWLVRSDDGGGWAVRLPGGRHQVELDVPLPAELVTLDLPLALAPAEIDVEAEGWQVDGVRNGRADTGNLRLLRTQDEAAGETRLEAGTLPPWLRVTRELVLGPADWTVETTVERLSQPGAAIGVEIPLLPGERPTGAGLRVEHGRLVLTLGPDDTESRWSSTLARSDTLQLVAGDGPWNEVWQLTAAPLWHVTADGTPLVHRYTGSGDWQPQWRPRPGESLKLAIGRPDGVPGAVVTLDSARLALAPGADGTLATLDLAVRASRGLDHLLGLPAGAVPQQALVDGRPLPLTTVEGRLLLPIRPGAQSLRILWRQPGALDWHYVAPLPELGLPGANLRIDAQVPADRWVLFAAGPRLGPAVLFWGVLAVLAAGAVMLARLHFAPLGLIGWLLLAIGLAPLDPLLLLVPAGWFALCTWRERHAARLGPLAFDALQIALAFATLALLAVLVLAVEQGLLGAPDLQIAGNGSSGHLLRWYQDRSPPAWQPGEFWSAPLWVYRLLMLGWALWLAWALLGWLRWGWQCWGRDGHWRPLRKPGKPDKPDKPDATVWSDGDAGL